MNTIFNNSYFMFKYLCKQVLINPKFPCSNNHLKIQLIIFLYKLNIHQVPNLYYNTLSNKRVNFK